MVRTSKYLAVANGRTGSKLRERSCKSIEEAEEVRRLYILKGFESAVIISCFKQTTYDEEGNFLEEIETKTVVVKEV